jgi:ATP-dependent 26S proteasome regulatory subunit
VLDQSEALRGSNIESEDQKRIKETIERCIVCTTVFGSLDDVIGFDDAKADIIDSLMLPIEVPSAFKLGVKQNNMFLLYGLPGIQNNADMSAHSLSTQKYILYCIKIQEWESHFLPELLLVT